MEQVSTRDLLQELATSPLGSKELQEKQTRRGPNAKPLPEVLEVGKRCAKIWLPQGKKPPRGRKQCNVETAEQTDIEDAVEAAGGRRGGQRAA
jgi:hypothetical protein